MHLLPPPLSDCPYIVTLIRLSMLLRPFRRNVRALKNMKKKYKKLKKKCKKLKKSYRRMGRALAYRDDKDELLNLAQAGDDCDMDRVREIIEAGINTRQVDESGQTCMMTAAWNGMPEFIQALCDADPHKDFFRMKKWTGDGETALDYATMQGHDECIEIMKAHGAKSGADC